jgi:rhamnosyltransferase
MDTQCSIVIRAYNEADHIGRLLQGIAQQSGPGREVLVVDSGSTDPTVAVAEAHGAEVIHIPAAEFSFGRSLNLGVQAAQNEYVVIASAHVYPVFPDWLQCLLEPFQEEQVAAVYGRQRGTPRSRLSEDEIFRQWFPETDGARQPSPFCNNANAAIRRSLWEKHPYDETLTGLEDVAWAKWAQGQGYHVHYAARAEVIHVHNETPRAVLHRYRREGMAFKRIFPESHFSAYDFARLTASNIASDLRHAASRPGGWRHAVSIFWFRTLQFWGTYQGYRRSGPVTQQLRQTFYYPRAAASSEARERPVRPIRYED